MEVGPGRIAATRVLSRSRSSNLQFLQAREASEGGWQHSIEIVILEVDFFDPAILALDALPAADGGRSEPVVVREPLGIIQFDTEINEGCAL